MADHPVIVETIRFRRMFPWLHLFRTFWIAADLRKLLLAGIALLLIAGGDSLFDRLPFAPQPMDTGTGGQAPLPQRWPWDQKLGYDLWHGEGALSLAQGVLANPWRTLDTVASNWQVVLRPMTALMEPAFGLLQPQATWSDRAYHVTRFLWSLCVWAIFGGAITRMAAVQFARDQQASLWSALKFSSRRFLDYVSAPLLPLGAVLLLGGLCALGSLMGRIPGIGEFLVGLGWGIGLLLSFLMALVLIGIGAGWPLMFATISVEASDGFDGLSRAYNYVFERPWLYLWSIIVAMCYGSLVIFFVWFVGEFVIHLSGWGAAWSLGSDITGSLLRGTPQLFRNSHAPGGDAPPSLTAFSWGSRLVTVWLCGVAVLVLGFVYSYFWTSITTIYFILRHSADGNDFDEVHLDEAAEPDHLLPLVGEAAMAANRPNSVPAAKSEQPAAAPPIDLSP